MRRKANGNYFSEVAYVGHLAGLVGWLFLLLGQFGNLASQLSYSLKCWLLWMLFDINGIPTSILIACSALA
jgi:hypothetical protein